MVSRSSSWRSSCLPPGSPIMPGAAAGQRDGPVAGLLEPPQRAELQQVAHVEAVGRRVEAGVDREPRLVEALREIRVGHLVDQAAEGEVLRERGHASTLPYAGRLIGRMGIRSVVSG